MISLRESVGTGRLGGNAPRPVQTEETVNLCLLDMQINTINSMHIPVMLRKVFSVNDIGHSDLSL